MNARADVITNSYFLSTTEARKYLKEKFNYAISVETLRDLMRTHQIWSLEKPSSAKHKAARVVTTAAALEMWLDKGLKANHAKGLSRMEARQNNSRLHATTDDEVLRVSIERQIEEILEDKPLTARTPNPRIESQAESLLRELEERQARKKAKKAGRA